MEVLENTENDRQIDHWIIGCCVIALSIGTNCELTLPQTL
nr:hypothetical protein [Vibrio cholerae]